MRLILIAIVSILSFSQLKAQSPTDVLPKTEVDSLIFNYSKVLKETYFNKTLIKEISSTLQKKLKAGDFYNKTQLTDRLSLLLREITKDNHFYIGKTEPQSVTNIEEPAAPETEFKNGGIIETKIINQKIGYIKWTNFIADDEAFEKTVAALQFVKGSKYLIFDLSECPGGDGRIGSFINSHLFEENDYQNLLQKKCAGETEWHQSEVPYNYSNGPKFYDIPVFVITSKHTASAAEYFALIIKEMKRGIVLGETTAGAGNPSIMVPFGKYFAQIPICEIETREGKSIEGKGVTPNIKLQSVDLISETVKYIEKNYQ
ncbi:S41 family peptidase [Epilithonimonas sp. UC225_85]|uniref:S41 family peptidase n=1 Tax=Epilithonimonas sp. UC225_85 TaxID=3350167 RepID=UPI0036D2D01D